MATAPQRSGRAARRPLGIPGGFAVELATLVDAIPPGRGWLYEVKLDGYRLVARVERGRAVLCTRAGNDWTERFPAVAAAVAALPAHSAVLDGEVIALLHDGSASFQALQNALEGGPPGTRLCYLAFDLLWLNGRDLRGQPLIARKQLLAKLLAGVGDTGVVRYHDHVLDAGDRLFEEVCRRGLEGIIAKRAGAAYHAGRTREWLKIKCLLRQEFVIGGFTDPEGARAGFGALLVGTRARRGGPLIYAGKVGTGFSQARLAELLARMRPLERPSSPFTGSPPRRGVHWLEPVLVAEIAFAQWTGDGKVRHSSFVGLREDKAAADVVRESPVHLGAQRR